METEMSSELFSYKFYLAHKEGHKLYPIRIKNRETGKLAFRVSEGGTRGNTKEIGLEITDENQVKNYVLKKGFAVRVSTVNKSVQGLYKVGQRSILEAVVK
jgi:hypothetical protein